MSDELPLPYHIRPASQAQQSAALRLLFAEMQPDERATHVTALLRQVDAAAIPLAGLLVASRGEQLVGAAWTLIQPGRVALVWPPRLVAGEPEATAAALAAESVHFAERQGVRLAQAALTSDSGSDARRLQAAGFSYLTDLLYLVSDEAVFPTSPSTSPLHFEPFESGRERRLADIMTATYEGTLDCPQLNHVRAMDDVLAGYRATGQFQSDRWRFVQAAGRDVGCLLLSEHPPAGDWELIYMGLVPAARGRGWGLEVVRAAQWLAREGGARRLVLAVDAENRPAVAMYAAAGFAAWDRRRVLLRVFADPKDVPSAE